MEIKENTIEYKNNKIKKDITIAHFSDIHLINHKTTELFGGYIEKIKQIKPDYICYTGDILHDTKKVKEKGDTKYFLILFKHLAMIAPVLIIKGNHDLATYGINPFKRDNTEEYHYNEFYEDLNKINNLRLLQNEEITYENICFKGFEEDYESYKILYEEETNFIQNINSIFKEGNPNKLNIILSHSPINILNKNITDKIKVMKNADLVLCGHTHDGIVPSFLSKAFKENTGIISPDKKLFPKIARGTINLNNTLGIIASPGFTFAPNSVMSIFNIFYPKIINVIKIKKTN